MSKETGPAPAEAEEVSAPKPERKMPSLEDLKARNAAEATAAERRNNGETLSGNLEVVAAEADARAQEKLLAQNTGLFNRISNVAKRAWGAVKAIGGVFGFVNKDIILPVKDAFTDVLTGRKEDGEAVAAVEQRIDALQTQISTATPEARGALEQQLTDAQEEMAELRDPYNAARARAEREKAQAKADQVEGKAFLKSEEEQMKAEKLAADVAAAKEKHAAKLEREAEERTARTNLGRGAAMLIVKAAGEDPSTMTLSDKELSAIGAVIEAAKSAVRMPERIRTGVGEYVDEETAKAQAAWEITRDAARDAFMVEDFKDMAVNLADAAGTTKKVVGASLSITAAALMNKEVQDGVIKALGLEEHEKGDGSIESQSARGILKSAIKSGAVSSKDFMRKAVVDTYKDVRDSEIVKDYGPAARKTGLAVGALLASPILVPGAAIYFGGKYGGQAAMRGYEAGTAAASKKLTEMSPAIADVVAPMIMMAANIADAPGDAKKEFKQLGKDMHDVLMTTAEDINRNTKKAAEAYNTLATRMRALQAGAMALYNKLEADAITEAAKAKNPEVAANVSSAIDLKAEVDAATSNVDAPAPRNVKPVIRQVRGSSNAA